MKNIANADRPKSVGAMLPPRPFRGSGKVAQTACNSKRRDGKSCIPTLNQTFADSRILKISKFHTFRIAGVRGDGCADVGATARSGDDSPFHTPRNRTNSPSSHRVSVTWLGDAVM